MVLILPTVYVFLCILTTNGRYFEDSRFQSRPVIVTDNSTKRSTPTFRGQQSGKSVTVYQFTRRHKPGDNTAVRISAAIISLHVTFKVNITEMSFAIRKIKSSRMPLLFSILYTCMYMYLCIHTHIHTHTQSVSWCSPWLQTFITRKPKDLH